MKYALLVYLDPADFADETPEEGIRLTDAAIDYDAELRERGQFIMGQALEPVEAAVTVRVRNGKMAATDGPFAETKEQLAGFMLIEARDLNEAVQIAAAAPMSHAGTIEVRPFRELTHS
jgi:hypothetical protein